MTEHKLNLPDSLYQQLLLAAQEKGVSPVEWIAMRLSAVETGQHSTEFPAETVGSADNGREPYQNGSGEDGTQSQPLSELLSGLTGTVNSRDKASHDRKPYMPKDDDAFGEEFIAKMAKQGIHLP